MWLQRPRFQCWGGSASHSFKYLGTAKSAENMLGPFMAGRHIIRQFARKHHLNDRPQLSFGWL